MSSSPKHFNVKRIREDFPNLRLHLNEKPLVYLDNGATTFKAQPVIDALTHHYTEETSNVHRGLHTLSERATSAYEGARERVKNFINASSVEEIIFTSGTTDAINLVAYSYGRAAIGEGDEIIITHMEHHSNIVPWQMLCEEKKCVLKIAPINDQGELIWEEFEKLITDKTKLISVVYISNSLGTINPVEKIIAAAHTREIPVLIDAAQVMNHSRVDVQALDCDFFVFSAHKMYGPTGTGVLYGKKNLLNAMPPFKGGGDMISSVSFEKTVYNSLPYKFEAGTPHIAGVIGLGAAVDYLGNLDFDGIQAHKADLVTYATEQLKAIDGIRIIGEAKNKASIVSFIHSQVHAHDMGTLVDKEGVAVRTGHHCTQPVMDRFGITATSRASFAMYNTRKEVDILVKAVGKAIEIFNG